MLRFPLFGHIHFNRGSDPFNRLLLQSNDITYVARLSFFKPSREGATAQ